MRAHYVKSMLYIILFNFDMEKENTSMSWAKSRKSFYYGKNNPRNNN